jgi:hypothetical protein
MKVKLLKALHFGGVRQEAGAEMDLATPLACELIARGAVGPVGAPAPTTGPMTIESAEALVVAAATPKKGKAHAGQ